jgi:hypothetical protein
MLIEGVGKNLRTKRFERLEPLERFEPLVPN